MGTATGMVTRVDTIRSRVPAQATAGSDLESGIGVVPYNGNINAVRYAADAAYTGAATNYRSFQVRARTGAAAARTVAQLDGINAVNLAAFQTSAVTIVNNGTSNAPARDVLAGDVLTYYSLHVGTGLADPGGLVEVDILRD